MSMSILTGGAAVKAGVQEGDRIIKVFTFLLFSVSIADVWLFSLPLTPLTFPSQVNGSLVSSMSHQEVVKLIKCEF